MNSLITVQSKLHGGPKPIDGKEKRHYEIF